MNAALRAMWWLMMGFVHGTVSTHIAFVWNGKASKSVEHS